MTLEETYEANKNWIYKIVWDFQQRYGGEFEELLAEANYGFVLNMKKYKPRKGKVTTWLYQSLTLHLRNYRQHEHIKNQVSVETPHHTNANLFIMDFLSELSTDALTVLTLFLETPTQIFDIAREDCPNPRHVGTIVKRRLTNQLQQKQGWPANKTKRIFKELAECSH